MDSFFLKKILTLLRVLFKSGDSLLGGEGSGESKGDGGGDGGNGGASCTSFCSQVN